MLKEAMEKTQDQISDKATWLVISVFVVLSCLIQVSSKAMEAARRAVDSNLAAEWLFEISSHAAILAATLIIPYLLYRFPLSVENWNRRWPVYFLGFIGFVFIHVSLMVAIRIPIFPMLADGPYDFGYFTWEPWIYEARKDALTYLTFLSLFLIARQVGQLKIEASAARKEARDTGRLTLKCGGKIIFLSAEEILYAKAAANYVEVFTETGQHLARMTLSSLEALLLETSTNHMRIHRSYLVNSEPIRTITPGGDGDAVITLKSGEELPFSRKYRASLEPPLQ